MGLKLNLSVALFTSACAVVAAANMFETRYNPPISIFQPVQTSQQLITEKHWWHGAPLVIESYFGSTNIANLGNFSNGGLEFESSMLYAAGLGELDVVNPPLDYPGSVIAPGGKLQTYEMQITCPHSDSGMCNLLLAYDPEATKPSATVLVKTGVSDFILLDAKHIDQLAGN